MKPLRVVLAPDKFKGSLSAIEVASAMAEGVLDACSSADTVLCPMADGGEGTVEAVASAVGVEMFTSVVDGPLPEQRVEARWLIVPAGKLERVAGGARPGLLSHKKDTAVIEMAQASGYSLVPPRRRDPLVTSTVGTGQLIREAMESGCRQIVVGVGGSATVDGGTGMASALGYRFLDEDGRELDPRGESLEKIAAIDDSSRNLLLEECSFMVATDVDNPLVGDRGAARVYGPQKGATESQVDALDRGLSNLAGLVNDRLGADVLDLPGAGAAGGLGAGLAAFCGARIYSGVRLVATLTGLAEKVRGADLVLTGEGSYDIQTSYGKTPMGVIEISREAGVPVVVVAGRTEPYSLLPRDEGVGVYSVIPGPMEEVEAMEEAAELVRHGTARLTRLVLLMGANR